MSDDARAAHNGQAIESLSAEERRFPPPPDLAAHANVTEGTFEQAAADGLGFWAEQADRLSLGHPHRPRRSTGATPRSPRGTPTAR